MQRYEWPHVGDLLHLDLKRLGRVVGVGHRIHGNRRRRTRGAGWEYLHVALDDATRLTYAEVLPADDAGACGVFLQRTLAWFRRRGVTVRRLLTDNALAYKSRAERAICGRWSVRHRYTRPYRPQTNGKAERLIQTLLREWALPDPVSQLRPPHRRAPPVSPLLQPPPSTRQPRPALAVDAFPRGCMKMNNLFDIHSYPLARSGVDT